MAAMLFVRTASSLSVGEGAAVCPLRKSGRKYFGFRDAGYSEVVLSGIHLGQWGKDLQPAARLVDLVDSLQEEAFLPHLRFSSLETMEWGEGLIQGLTRWRGICRHFHVPLQSGDEEILRRMHRPYNPQDFAEVILELRRLFPTAALGSDVLAGFPGETENQFRQHVGTH